MKYLLLRAAVILAFCVSAHAQMPFGPKELAGIWESDGCESQDLGNGQTTFFKRTYRFTESDWSVVRTIYADGQCGRALLTWRLAGKYVLGNVAKGIPDAREGNFGFASFMITVDDEAGLPVVKGCGLKPWRVGVQQDVGKTGCAVIKPLAKCPVDHDLAAIRKGVLYPGQRTPDMCSPAGRPVELQKVGAKRRAATN